MQYSKKTKNISDQLNLILNSLDKIQLEKVKFDFNDEERELLIATAPIINLVGVFLCPNFTVQPSRTARAAAQQIIYSVYNNLFIFSQKNNIFFLYTRLLTLFRRKPGCQARKPGILKRILF